jgi:hypothetical protein
MSHVGFEPTTNGLKVRCSNQTELMTQNVRVMPYSALHLTVVSLISFYQRPVQLSTIYLSPNLDKTYLVHF